MLTSAAVIVMKGPINRLWMDNTCAYISYSGRNCLNG